MKHLDAVNESIAATKLDRHPSQAPLIELCRTLAGQMDAAGDDPSTRLTAAYLSALKDLRRANEAMPTPRDKPSSLAAMRAAHPRPTPIEAKKTRRRTG